MGAGRVSPCAGRVSPGNSVVLGKQLCLSRDRDRWTQRCLQPQPFGEFVKEAALPHPLPWLHPL